MAVCLAGCSQPDDGSARLSSLPDDALRSGYEFLQPDSRALQDDTFSNPGFLWVDEGKRLFETGTGQADGCASCHDSAGMSLEGSAAHFPRMDSQSGQLVNLEGQINLCRIRYQEVAALDYESRDLLALTAYVASLSRGQRISVDVSGPAADYYQQGEEYFFLKKGQFDLACSQCHNENWGRQLRGETISQGHGNGFPAYRLEWQDFGSLHRRFRDCDKGIRAEPHPYGSQTYLALELYLAKRAEGLSVEAPGIRR